VTSDQPFPIKVAFVFLARFSRKADVSRAKRSLSTPVTQPACMMQPIFGNMNKMYGISIMASTPCRTGDAAATQGVDIRRLGVFLCRKDGVKIHRELISSYFSDDQSKFNFHC
jgi:hypothetical protein